MPDKLLRSFFLDRDLARGLKAAGKGEHMSQALIVRLALREWLEDRDYVKRGGTRKTR